MTTPVRRRLYKCGNVAVSSYVTPSFNGCLEQIFKCLFQCFPSAINGRVCVSGYGSRDKLRDQAVVDNICDTYITHLPDLLARELRLVLLQGESGPK